MASTNLWRDVDNYGAVGDGVTMNTVAIQAAIKACPAGGVVWLHGGIFRSGTVILHDNMTLYIDTNATLLAHQLMTTPSWLRMPLTLNRSAWLWSGRKNAPM